MKFKNYLDSIAGISIYPLISLVIFVTFFRRAAVVRFQNEPLSTWTK